MSDKRLDGVNFECEDNEENLSKRSSDVTHVDRVPQFVELEYFQYF